DWIFWAALPALMLHQAEEYVYPGGFREWLNRSVFHSEDSGQPLAKQAALIVNIPVLWILFAVTAYIGGDILWFSLPVFSLLVVNAWFHIVMSVVYNDYVPGSYTSIIVLLPLTLYGYSLLLTTWQTDYAMLMISIMAALIVHIFFISILRGRLKALQETKGTE
ncbi:HXXEE domain-containing protein, partial [bacterium]|nr:HXXEE domain-containing protein [bacterium]